MPASFTKLTGCMPFWPSAGRIMRDIFLELRGLALEAGRGDVGEIVGDHIHRPIGGELLRKTNEK